MVMRDRDAALEHVETAIIGADGSMSPGRTADPEMPIAGVLAALDDVAKDISASRSLVATAWVLSSPAVTSVVSGAGRTIPNTGHSNRFRYSIIAARDSASFTFALIDVPGAKA